MKLLITSVRNEAPYLVEWIAWHKMLGFDHFLIYTNDNTDNTKELLEKISRLGFVTWKELFPGADERPQMVAFSQALNWVHQNKPDWIAVFDVDEFLNLKQDENLDSFLNRYPKADAIAINWRIFGSSHLRDKGIGLTPERFVWAAQDEYPIHSTFKSIFKYNPELIRFHHRAVYKDSAYKNLRYIFADGMPLSEKIIKPGPFTTKQEFYYSFSVAQLNHYAIRSISEYRKKRIRGNGFTPNSVDISKADKEYLRRFDKNNVFDNSILRRLGEYSKMYLDICKESNISLYIS